MLIEDPSPYTVLGLPINTKTSRRASGIHFSWNKFDFHEVKLLILTLNRNETISNHRVHPENLH